MRLPCLDRWLPWRQKPQQPIVNVAVVDSSVVEPKRYDPRTALPNPPHFMLDDLLVSETAARHNWSFHPVNDNVVAYLAHLSEHILDPLFEAVFVETGARLTVTSGYRFPKLNRAIGGASNSAHMVGRAADCKAPGIYAQKLFDIAHALRPKLPFDKLIFEHNAWIHVQIAKQGRDPRDQVWAAYKRGDDTKYESGGRPPNGKWV